MFAFTASMAHLDDHRVVPRQGIFEAGTPPPPPQPNPHTCQFNILVRLHGVSAKKATQACVESIKSIEQFHPEARICLHSNVRFSKKIDGGGIVILPLRADKLLLGTPLQFLVEQHTFLKWFAMHRWDQHMETALTLALLWANRRNRHHVVMPNPGKLQEKANWGSQGWVSDTSVYLRDGKTIWSAMQAMHSSYSPHGTAILTEVLLSNGAQLGDFPLIRKFSFPRKHFAVLDYRTNNVGDWIQSYAALQFLPFVDVKVNRDWIRADASNFSRPVVVFLNAYWTSGDGTACWPPPDNVDAIPIAIHIAYPKLILTEAGIAWFKKNEPILTRDIRSQNLLRAKGVNAIFAGCLTLTIRREKWSYRHGTLIALEHNIHGKLHPEVKILPDVHWMDVYYNLISDSASMRQYPTAYREFELQDRMWGRAVRNLELMGTVEKVITDRLHVALPATSMGTPTLFVDGGWDSSGRYTGLLTPVEARSPEHPFPRGPMGVYYTNSVNVTSVDVVHSWGVKTFEMVHQRRTLLRQLWERIQSNELLSRSAMDYGIWF